MSDPYHNGDLHPGPRQGAGDALRRLSDWLGHDEDQGDEAPPMNRRCSQRCCSSLLYAACKGRSQDRDRPLSWARSEGLEPPTF